MTTALRLDPRAGLVRGVRAAVLTVPAVGVSALAHGMADGCGNLTGTLLAMGACWPGAVALLGARRRLPAVLAWVVLAQVLTHVLLEATCGPTVATGMAVLSGAMVAAHLAAALLTAAVLQRADAGLWAADALLRAGARFVRSLALLTTDPVLPVVAPARCADAGVLLPRSRWEAAPLLRRGPPVATVR